MTNQLAARAQEHPKDAKTGLTLPLSKSLDLRALAKHRAHVAVELEVMAKKLDRFGWDRDRGTATHDRLITDWMDALQDYPLAEVQAACRKWLTDNPNAKSMPHEGTIKSVILKARHEQMTLRKPVQQEPEPEHQSAPRATQEQRDAILAEKGYGHLPSVIAKKFPAIGEAG